MDMRIERANMADLDGIFALYRSLIGMPYSTWTEDYPTRELVEADLKRNDVFVMRDETGRIISAISHDFDDEYDDMAPWYDDVTNWAQLYRLGVARDCQGQGIARKMLLHAMQQKAQEGCQAVRFLVSAQNIPAQRSYNKLGFDVCGETDQWGEHWLCYQKRLAR